MCDALHCSAKQPVHVQLAYDCWLVNLQHTRTGPMHVRAFIMLGAFAKLCCVFGGATSVLILEKNLPDQSVAVRYVRSRAIASFARH